MFRSSSLNSRRLAAALLSALLLATPICAGMRPNDALRALQTLGGDTEIRLRALVKPYVGVVRYRWGGNSVRHGMDCSAFTKFVYAQLGVTLPRTVAEQAKTGTHLEIWEIRPGDLLFYDTSVDRPGVDHVAIHLGQDKIVHSKLPVGVVIDRFCTYKHRVKFGRRVL